MRGDDRGWVGSGAIWRILAAGHGRGTPGMPRSHLAHSSVTGRRRLDGAREGLGEGHRWYLPQGRSFIASVDIIYRGIPRRTRTGDALDLTETEGRVSCRWNTSFFDCH